MHPIFETFDKIMVKKILLLGIFLFACDSLLIAQVSFDVTMAEKKRIVSGSIGYRSSDDEAFANALLWAVNEGPGRKEEILDCDFLKRQLTMVYILKRNEEPAYTCRLTLKLADGQMMFLINDIKIQGGLLSSFQNFDKLNPEKKPKHQDIINEFQSLNNQKLQKLISFISENKPEISNWKEVCLGQLKNGMSIDEVKLIYGKPISIQESGTDAQYVFSTFVYVFLENGKVKSFVN